MLLFILIKDSFYQIIHHTLSLSMHLTAFKFVFFLNIQFGILLHLNLVFLNIQFWGGKHVKYPWNYIKAVNTGHDFLLHDLLLFNC